MHVENNNWTPFDNILINFAPNAAKKLRWCVKIFEFACTKTWNGKRAKNLIFIGTMQS